MKNFLVKVKAQAGGFNIIKITADSAQNAMDIASLQGHIPAEAFEDVESAPSRSYTFGSVPSSELYHFTRLFATLTRAGIPILETLDLLTTRVSNNTLQYALEDINRAIRDGNGLKASFAKHPRVFDSTYLQLVEVGEESGKLPQILERLAFLLKKKLQLRGMVIKALTYPMLVVFVSTIVVSGIMIFIVPRFKGIYAKFGGELPSITLFTISFSDFVVAHIVKIVVSLIAAVFALMAIRKTTRGKKAFDAVAFRIPLFGSMLHTYEIAGFSKSFAMLIHSGITVTSSLELIVNAVDCHQVADALRDANASIKNGRPLAESFDKQEPWLPDLLNRMVDVGERTGNLSEMLDHVADYYEEEFYNKVEVLASLIEPILIVCLGIIIGVIVVSLYLPIFGMAKLVAKK